MLWGRTGNVRILPFISRSCQCFFWCWMQSIHAIVKAEKDPDSWTPNELDISFKLVPGCAGRVKKVTSLSRLRRYCERGMALHPILATDKTTFAGCWHRPHAPCPVIQDKLGTRALLDWHISGQSSKLIQAHDIRHQGTIRKNIKLEVV